MKIILSRKGFDSAAGGCPSPIFPDGRMLSLPIPDKSSPIAYSDIFFEELNVGDLVAELSEDAKRRRHFAHLDPDVRAGAIPRAEGWKPLFGQTGSAQGHLRNQGIAVGDVFVFFGSFKPVEKTNAGWRFKKREPTRHVIWGWLQVGKICSVDNLQPADLPWGRYHPHFSRSDDPSNTLYVAADRLVLGGALSNCPAAGVFSHFNERLALTAAGASAQTHWRLPKFFAPLAGASSFSYHQDASRWRVVGDECFLSSALRGQEFVFDAQSQKEPVEWLRAMIESATDG